MERQILLSELLKGTPYRIKSIGISIKKYTFPDGSQRWFNPAVVYLDGPIGLEVLLIPPLYWKCDLASLDYVSIPSIEFDNLKLVLVETDESKEYHWETAFSSKVDFSVLTEPFLEHFDYGSSTVTELLKRKKSSSSKNLKTKCLQPKYPVEPISSVDDGVSFLLSSILLTHGIHIDHIILEWRTGRMLVIVDSPYGDRNMFIDPSPNLKVSETKITPYIFDDLQIKYLADKDNPVWIAAHLNNKVLLPKQEL